MGLLLGFGGGNRALEGARHRKIDDVRQEVHRAPEDDVEAVGCEAEKPGEERLRKGVDKRAGACKPGKRGTPRHIVPSDGGTGFGCFGHSSVRTSTVSPISRNRKNGAQAASSGG